MSLEPMPAPEILPLGEDSVVLRFARHGSEAASHAALALHARIEALIAAGQMTGAIETAPALASVLLRFERARRAEVLLALNALLQAPPAALPQGRLWRVPACFDGPDLAEASALAGVSVADAVAQICGQDLIVRAIGFAPAQPYLGYLPPNWEIARLPALTPRVEAGTITVALRQIVLFTRPSPTGWRALGHTAFVPALDAARRLSPRDRLRFVAVSGAELAQIRASGDPMGGAR